MRRSRRWISRRIIPPALCAPPDTPADWPCSFALQPDGSVAGLHTFARELEGYPGVIHGGIVAAALNGAMTNCLFLHHQPAVTAELKIRFLHPVASRVPALIRARLVERSGPLFVIGAELLQHGRHLAAATAKFIANAAAAEITGAGP